MYCTSSKGTNLSYGILSVGQEHPPEVGRVSDHQEQNTLFADQHILRSCKLKTPSNSIHINKTLYLPFHEHIANKYFPNLSCYVRYSIQTVAR